jgi:membrane-associated phospholipid phosphatase
MGRAMIQEDEAALRGSAPGDDVGDRKARTSTPREDETSAGHVLGRGMVVWLIAFVGLAALVIGLGLLLTHVLLPDGLASLDARVADWFKQQRTPTLDTITLAGSDLGSTGVIIGIAVLTVVVLAIKKEWWWAGFVVAALSLEASVSLVSSTVVDRRRPQIPRLDATPPTASYPSGHTAASIVMYVALAIVFSALVQRVGPRVVVWILAIAVPVFVAVSRLYLGMHHLTDIAASVLLGVSALLLGRLVTLRAAVGGAGPRRDPSPTGAPNLDVAP